MATWYIVKINWETISKNYLGLGGDYWPDIQYLSEHAFSSNIDAQLCGNSLLKKVEANSNYVDISGMTHHVVADCSVAEEYYWFLNNLDLCPIFISVTDDLETEDADGYDFGNPAGGYSVIESVILTLGNEELKVAYLNKHLLFDNMDIMNDFLRSMSDRDDVEELDCYCAVSIKQISL